MAFRIVGAVGVRVRPDTTKFSSELRDKLAKENPKVLVPVEPEVGKAFLEQVDHIATEGSRDAKASGIAVKLPAELGKDDLLSEARRMVDEVNDVIKNNNIAVKIPAVIDTDQLVESVSRAVEEAQAKLKEKGKLKVQATLDLDHEQAQRELDRFVHNNNNTNIDLNADIDRRGRVREQLAVLTRHRDISIRPTLDKRAMTEVESALLGLTGFNILKRYGGDLRNIVTNLDTFALSVAKIGTVVGTLVAGGASGYASLSTIGADLLSIGGAAAALPALLGSAVSVVAVGVGAFKGFKDAIDGNKEALDKLPPSAQRSAKALQGTWTELQKPIQKNFWDGAGNAVPNLVKNVMKPLKAGLAGVAGALGGAFGGALSGINTSALNGDLGKMFSGLTKGVKNASVGLSGFVRGIMAMGAAGSKWLPDMGTWFGDLGTKFQAWVTDASAKGKIDKWLDTAKTKFGNLKDSVKDLGGAFSAINDAAKRAGAGGLISLSDRIHRMRTDLEGYNGQTLLTGLFSGAKTAMQNIKDGLDPLIQTVVDFAPKLEGALGTVGSIVGSVEKMFSGAIGDPTFQKGFIGLFDGVAAGAKKLQPYGPVIGQIFGALGSVAGSLFSNIAPVLGQGLETVATALSAIAEPAKEIGKSLSGAMVYALQAITPMFAALAPVMQVFAKAIAAVPTPLLAVAVGIVALRRAFGALKLATIVGGWAKGLSGFGSVLKNAFKPGIWTQTAERFARNNSTFGTAIGSAMLGLKNTISGWGSKLGGWISKIFTVGVIPSSGPAKIGGWIKSFGATISKGFYTALGSLAGLNFSSKIAGLNIGGKISGALSSVFSAIKPGNLGATLTKWFYSAIGNLGGMNFAAAFANLGIGPKISGALSKVLSPIKSVFTTAGGWISTGLSAIGSKISSWASSIGTKLSGALKGKLGPALSGLTKGALTLGGTLGLGLAAVGLAGMAQDAQATRDALAQAATNAQNIGKSLAQSGSGNDSSAQAAADAASQQVDDLVSKMQALNDSGMVKQIQSNRQGLIDAIIGKPSAGAEDAVALLEKIQTVANSNAGGGGFLSGIGRGINGMFAGAASANKSVADLATGMLNSASAADTAKYSYSKLFSTNNNRNASILTESVQKLGMVNFSNLDQMTGVIHDFNGNSINKVEQFADLIATTLGGDQSTITTNAQKLTDGMNKVGTSSADVVNVLRGMNVPMRQIQDLFSQMGYSTDDWAKVLNNANGPVKAFGKNAVIAGQQVYKMAQNSTGVTELATALSQVTNIDPGTLETALGGGGMNDPAKFAAALSTAGVGYTDIAKALGSVGISGPAAQKALDGVRAQLQDVTGFSPQNVKDFATAMQQIADSAGTTADKINIMLAAIDQLNGGTLDASRAQAAFNAAYDDTAQAVSQVTGKVIQADGSFKQVAAATGNWAKIVDRATGSIDTTTEAGRALFSNLDQLRTTGYQLAQTTFDQVYKKTGDVGQAMDAASKATSGQVEGFKAIMKNAGLSDQAVQNLLQQFGLLPSQVTTNVGLIGTNQVQSELGTVLGLLANAKKPVDVHVGALTQGAIDGLKSVGAKVEKLTTGGYSVSLSANDSKARSQMQELLMYISGQKPQINVGVNYVYHGVAPKSNSYNKYVQGAMADGGIIKHGLKVFADGGFSDVARQFRSDLRHAITLTTKPSSAHIAPAGSYVMYAEKETGGEAFIPLASEKRGRSTAILAEVATQFGYSLVRKDSQVRSYANGSGTTVSAAGHTFNITMNNPTAEPSAEANLKKVMQLAGQY